MLLQWLIFKPQQRDNETFKKFFHGLLREGIYIAPSAYETWFITDALTRTLILRFRPLIKFQNILKLKDLKGSFFII
jgi:glutamate-1-semialdehyde aminotransferase